MSSLSDMLKWQNALNENMLLKSESLKKAFRKYKLKMVKKLLMVMGGTLEQ